MKKKLILILALAFVFGLALSSVQAATIFMTPTTQNVGVGDTVLLDLNIDFDTTGGAVDITYNNSILDYTGVVFTAGQAFAQIEPTETDTGSAGNLSGRLVALTNGGFPSLIDPADLPGSIAQLSFTALAMGSTFAGVVLNNGFTQADTFAGATVNVVPIPGSILLLGSGLVGLIGIARRKRS